MRAIRKEAEPSSLTAWIQENPQGRYGDLTPDIRRTIRQHALEEQFYLCAYCCQRIGTIDDCHNEHLEAQSLNPARSLDFSNIVASCNTSRQCGKAHQSQLLPLTPVMAECETELQFNISGRVRGLSDRAQKMIQVLNLGDHEKNNRALVEKRKALSDALLWKYWGDPQELEDEHSDILRSLIDELAQPNQEKLEPFAPVVVNIVRSWLQA